MLQYIDQEIRELKIKDEDKETIKSKVKTSEISSIKKGNFEDLI